jgi:GH24 family phage-related lysozyme (muramidase)
MTVPASTIALLKLREGFSAKPYKDTVGKWTVGTGHLMSQSEIAQYGLKKALPQPVLDNWLQADALAAYKAALTQAQAMKVTDARLIDVLTSVNFQLGTAWTKKFPQTWKALLERRYAQAIANINTSLWMRQTPVRAKDFQEAIRGLMS